MTSLAVALYARVSSDQQTDAHTIASQLSALRARVAADGFPLPEELQFIDEGYSGATLVRPGLECLRDLIAAGGVERLYVHSPDRLARKYVHQVLLIEELQQHNCQVEFLDRPMSQDPHDQLLLGIPSKLNSIPEGSRTPFRAEGEHHRSEATLAP